MQVEKERITRQEFEKMKLPKYVYDQEGRGFAIIWHWHKDGYLSFSSYRLGKTTLSDQNWAIQTAKEENEK